LAAGFRPNALGELKRSPDFLAAIWGLLLRGEEGKERVVTGEVGMWKGKEGEGKRRGSEGGGAGALLTTKR